MAKDPCNKCGEPSDIGAHGIRDGKIYDEYYCESCYNLKKRGKEEETERNKVS